MNESEILSTCMFDSENMLQAIDRGINKDWFTRVEDGLLYSVLVELCDTTMWNKRDSAVVLHGAKVFERFPFAMDYCRNTPSWAHNVEDFDSAIDVLRGKYMSKSLSLSVNLAMRRLNDGDDAILVADELVSSLEGIDVVAKDDSENIVDIAKDAYETARKIYEGEPFGLPFPWRSFQHKTFGIPAKTVCVLAGRGGEGKSRMATYLAHHWLQLQIPGLYFAFEDTSGRMIANLAATHGGYDMFDIRRRQSNTSFLEKHAKSLDEVSRFPLHVSDRSTSADRIVKTIARHHRKYDIKWVVIDGWKDIIQPRTNSKTECDDEIMATLVRAAKKYDVSILPVMHLTKIDEGEWIWKNNIRGSGNIINSSRMALLFQDAGSNGGKTIGEGEVALDAQKVSYGYEGCILLRKALEEGRFYEVQEEE